MKAMKGTVADMKKFNLSEIMKKAWNMVKNNKMSMSDALKKAWAIAKQNVIELVERFAIKDWFFEKNIEKFTSAHLTCYSTFAKTDIIKESEKAVYVNLDMRTSYGAESRYSKQVWIPKSCVELYVA